MKNLCYIKEALFLNFFFTIDCMNTKFFATRTFETFFVKKLIAQIVYHAAIKIVKKKTIKCSVTTNKSKCFCTFGKNLLGIIYEPE